VLLTRSPLGHPPEGGASLDLHVLSTPPAFVLSQDQTLREGLYDSWHKPVCRHRKSPSCDGFNHWFIRAGSKFLLDVPKESCTPSTKPGVDESYMALTFGTLLSSQGADAHLHDPFGAIGGNLRHITRSVPHGQTRPAPPESLLVGATQTSLGASCLGDGPPGSARPWPFGEVRCAAPLREQEQH
jgi:hypothetical protein